MEAGLYYDIVKGLEADHFNVARLEKTPQQWEGTLMTFIRIRNNWYYTIWLCRRFRGS